MKPAVFFIFIVTSIISAQTNFKIYGKIDNKPLVNIPVYFGDGNGVYSAADGSVHIPAALFSDLVTINAIGYMEQTLHANAINNSIVYLETTVYELPQITLRGKPKKINTERVKESKRGNVLELHGQYHGVEYGVFIPFEVSNSDAYLTAFTLPFSDKRPDWKTMREKLDKGSKSAPLKKIKNEFSFLYEIKFYQMDANNNLVLLEDEIIKQIVTEKQLVYTYEFKDKPIAFGDKGLLIGFHNLGPCDEKGVLVNSPRFIYKTNKDGKEYKLPTNIETIPNLVMRKFKNGTYDYSNYVNYHHTASSTFSKLPYCHLGCYKDGPENIFAVGYQLEIRAY